MAAFDSALLLGKLAFEALDPVQYQRQTDVERCPRYARGAIFAVAAGSLLAPANVQQFQAAWDASLFVFGVALLLVGSPSCVAAAYRTGSASS